MSKDWMTEAGKQSGERAERLRQLAVHARSPAEVFADSRGWIFIGLPFLGGAAALFWVENFRASVTWLLGGAAQGDLERAMLWVGMVMEAFSVGFLGTFVAVDIPLTVAVLLLKKYRPHLFEPRA